MISHYLHNVNRTYNSMIFCVCLLQANSWYLLMLTQPNSWSLRKCLFIIDTLITWLISLNLPRQVGKNIFESLRLDRFWSSHEVMLWSTIIFGRNSSSRNKLHSPRPWATSKKNAHRGSKKHLYFAVLSVAYHMDDSKNSGTPKWMVYNGKPYWKGYGGHTHGGFGNTHFSRLAIRAKYLEGLL